MKTGEYDVKQLRELLDNLSGMYDLCRVVDPAECRVLELGEDGSVRMKDRCYGIWNADQKCVNCQSAVACKTGCHQEKAEFFKDNVYHIQSNPVKLKLADGSVFDSVVELVSVGAAQGGTRPAQINDRESENTADRSARYRLMYDSLTGMLKADSFYERAREILSENGEKTWKMIVGDVVDFRLFNSFFSAEKGNEVLLKIAEQLRGITEKYNGICSRLYRDRFAVLLPAASFDAEEFLAAARAVDAAFSTGVYTICVHFGVYDVTDPELPVSVMAERATLALLKLDGSYRSSIAYFDDAMLQKSIDAQKIISGFDGALAEGRIRMYIQPLFDRDGRPFGAEALARWIASDGTVIPPDAFIQTLEGASLIHKLDTYIWEQAARQLCSWKHTEKENLSISVNMSAKDFYSIDVYRVLTDLVKKYDIDSEKLRLEITETTLMENLETISDAVARLQAAGFLVEIDDFGKGQSSLSLLKDIRADYLKIDMGFVQETSNKTRSRIILKSIIEMAKDLGMQVITEGVETESQRDALAEMGCARFQGYYFSKPIPVEEFEARFAVYDAGQTVLPR